MHHQFKKYMADSAKEPGDIDIKHDPLPKEFLFLFVEKRLFVSRQIRVRYNRIFICILGI